MKYAFTFGFFIIIANVQAQNFVVNPGFEIFKKGSGIPEDEFTRYGIRGWYQPTRGSSDWYCNISNDSNPIPRGFRNQNFGGKVEPHSGCAFGGIYLCYKSTAKPYAEYLAGSLMNTLIPGHTYTMSFWIQIGQRSDMYVHQVSVFFSADKVDSSEYLGPIDLKPQLIFKLDTVNKWTLISGEFVAQGTEQYFMLGTFRDTYDRSGSYRGTRRNIFESYGYYYFDDFSVVDKNPSGPISISAGQKFVCNNILFDVGKSTLTTSSYAQLDQIVVALKKQSTLKVQISGHTDSDGNAKANQTLSEQRAISVKNYFISKGIDSTRITTVGYGSSKPVSTDKAKNRRVEFYFTQ